MPRLALIVLVAVLALAEVVSAQEKVKVGVLKLTSSAPIFVGVERGFFKEYDVEPFRTGTGGCGWWTSASR